MGDLGKGKLTLCDLYKAFKALESSYGYFADVLAGIHCSGLKCDTQLAVGDEVGQNLVDLIEPPPVACDRPPDCNHGSLQYLELVTDIVGKSTSVAEALRVIIDEVGEKKIPFLTGSLPGWPYNR